MIFFRSDWFQLKMENRMKVCRYKELILSPYEENLTVNWILLRIKKLSSGGFFVISQGPVFVLIRFPLSRFQACKNSLMKNLSVHRNYSGAVSGLSRKVNSKSSSTSFAHTSWGRFMFKTVSDNFIYSLQMITLNWGICFKMVFVIIIAFIIITTATTITPPTTTIIAISNYTLVATYK